MRHFVLLAIITHLSALLLSFAAKAAIGDAPAFEGICRAKAKEVAAETYRSCVTENKKAQIEQIKNDYQSRLKALKDEYDGEIKRLSGKKDSAPAEKSSRVSRGPAPKNFPVKTKKQARASQTDPNSSEDVSVQLHQVERDDSSMDIPEPIPVENLQGND